MFINLTNFSNYYLSQILQCLKSRKCLEMDVAEKFLDWNRFQLDPYLDLVMTMRTQ